MDNLPKNLRDLTEIRINQRFGTFRAVDSNSGDTVFVKHIRHPNLEGSLRKEMYGLERISQLARMHDFPFIVPKIISNGTDYLVTSWAEGETMAFGPAATDRAERAEFLATGYAALDKATETVHPGRATFALPGDSQQNIARRLEANLQLIGYSDYFEPSLITRSVEQLESNLPDLEARFTHADFTPNNVIEDEEGKRTLIDWESASELWPRFYDIVNLTFNTRLAQPALSDDLEAVVRRSFELIESTPEAHLQQLNAIAIVRALSSITELMTEPNNYHNTTRTMDGPSAQLITTTLEDILRGKLYM